MQNKQLQHAMLLFCVVFVYAFFCGLFYFRFICLCNEAEAVVVAILCAFIWVALCEFRLKQEREKSTRMTTTNEV